MKFYIHTSMILIMLPPTLKYKNSILILCFRQYSQYAYCLSRYANGYKIELNSIYSNYISWLLTTAKPKLSTSYRILTCKIGVNNSLAQTICVCAFTNIFSFFNRFLNCKKFIFMHILIFCLLTICKHGKIF